MVIVWTLNALLIQEDDVLMERVERAYRRRGGVV